MKQIFPILLLMYSGGILCAADWSDNLYLGGNGYWHCRIPIQIVNSENVAAQGKSLSLRVGDDPGELAITGLRAEELRLTDAAGAELLFDLEKDGKKARKGKIESGTILYFPAVADAQKSTTLYLYGENPSAHQLPAFFWKRTPASSGVSAFPGRMEFLRLSCSSRKNNKGPSAAEWPVRRPVWVRNFSNSFRKQVLILLDFTDLPLEEFSRESFLLTNEFGMPLRFLRIGGNIIFQDSLPPLTEREYSLYICRNPQKRRVVGIAQTGSDILSDSVFLQEQEPVDLDLYRRYFESSANLVKDPSFEEKRGDWKPNIEGTDKSEISCRLTRDARFGKLAAQVCSEKAGRWAGWRSVIPLEAGKQYLFAAFLKGKNVSKTHDLYMHLRNTARVDQISYLKSRSIASDTFDWKAAILPFRVPSGNGNWDMRANLVTQGKGSLTYDGVLVSETIPARLGEAVSNCQEPRSWSVWSVNPVVKVFQDDLPPEKSVVPEVTMARNEREALQLVFRHPAPLNEEVEVRVSTPCNEKFEYLPKPEVGVVGYVLVDYPGEYYFSRRPEYYLAIPDGNGTGDGRFWPDPILPTARFVPKPGKAQPVWITFHAPAKASSGVYRGSIELLCREKILCKVPYSVRVWNFALPDSRTMEGVFDIRFEGHHYMLEGKNLWGGREEQKKAYSRIVELLTKRKLGVSHLMSQDEIILQRNPATGKIHCDFTHFDQMAGKLLDEQNGDFLYLRHRVLFLFEQPPWLFLGCAPYAGKYPYWNVDRRNLTVEYRTALSEAVTKIWNHLCEKGWEKKVYFYLADEPADKKEVIQQGTAILDVLRKAAPDMLIYCSTWRDIPEWHGRLNVWGIGLHGSMSVTEMNARRRAGDKLIFTLDGHMRIDTPYCAVERLLPIFCFKYDVEKYEFWCVNAMQQNQFQFGFPKFNTNSPAPGVQVRTRYPNGDGYLLYDGKFIGYDGVVPSIRLENCRDGIDDYDYLVLLDSLARRCGDVTGKKLIEEAKQLVTIPNAGGRYSAALLPEPEKIPALRNKIAERIEFLTNRSR